MENNKKSQQKKVAGDTGKKQVPVKTGEANDRSSNASMEETAVGGNLTTNMVVFWQEYRNDIFFDMRRCFGLRLRADLRGRSA